MTISRHPRYKHRQNTAIMVVPSKPAKNERVFYKTSLKNIIYEFFKFLAGKYLSSQLKFAIIQNQTINPPSPLLHRLNTAIK